MLKSSELWRLEVGPYCLINITVADSMFVANMCTGISGEYRVCCGYSNGNGAGVEEFTPDDLAKLGTQCRLLYTNWCCDSPYDTQDDLPIALLGNMAKAADDIWNEIARRFNASGKEW